MMPKKKREYDFTIYTDGSFRRPYFGAWGYIVLDKDEASVHEDAQPVYHTTNNRMELQAILEALRVTPEGSTILLYSDSQYCVNACAFWMVKWAKTNWITQAQAPVANRDILEQLFVEINKRKCWFVWVRAHNGNKYNELIDTKVQTITAEMLMRWKDGEKIPDPPEK